jgi:plastocyanin
MKRLVGLAAATITLVAVVAALAACGGSDPNVDPTATNAVSMRSVAFAPAHIRVSVGETVTWTNEDDVDHDVVFEGDGIRSPLVAGGATYEQTFETAGVFDYVCSVHPGMRGRVTVEGT